MRDVYEPISRDTDPVRRAQRLRAVERDLALRATGKPCPRCRNEAWSTGGPGCACPPSAAYLEQRCLDNADRARPRYAA